MSEEDVTEIVTEETPASAPGYTYDDFFQKKIVALCMKDSVFMQRTDGLIDPAHLEDAGDQVLISIVSDFYNKYKKVPDKSSLPMVIKAGWAGKKLSAAEILQSRDRFAQAMRADISDRDYVIDTVADFARQRAMEEAIIRSADLVEKKDYAAIEKIMRRALDVGAADENPAYDYFKEIDNRTAHRQALLTGAIKPDGITTGFPDLDKHMFHSGWGRKELSVVMARAKFGKSMGLGDFGKNAALAGYNVLIVTCETSARIYADRLDANFSETAMDMLKHKPTIVAKAIKEAEAKSAMLRIHEYGSGTLKPSQLRRLVEKYRGQGVIFDMIVVDYADIMAPEQMTGIPREDSRLIWLALRAIAQENNVAMLTATQTNRDGAKAAVASATDVAEDYNKIRTADLVISGNATDAEIKAGIARLHFAASRNQEEVTLEISQKRNQMKFLTAVLKVLH